MSKFLFITVILFILIASCKKDKKEQTITNNELKITFGTVCGWCAGSDSLTITKESTKFRSYSCSTSNYSFDSTTNKSDWDQLTGLLDLEKFSSININTCNVCVDGCDTWVSIKSDTNFHRISFGTNDSIAIQDIKPFIEELELISKRYIRPILFSSNNN
jgi:hypothetical protein